MQPKLKRKIMQINEIADDIYDMSDALDDKLLDWFSLTMNTYNEHIAFLNERLGSVSDEDSYNDALGLLNVCINIYDKMFFALNNNDKPLSSIIANFKNFDREQNTENNDFAKQYYLQQQIFYPQMLNNNGQVEISYFDVVDKDAFNQIFDK